MNHKILPNETNKLNINCEKFKYTCQICNFTSRKKSNYDIHLGTKKHKKKKCQRNTKTSSMKQKKCRPLHFMCERCNCNFNSRTTLWRHRSKCKGDNEPVFLCEACNMCFNNAVTLVKHREKICVKTIIGVIGENVKILKKENKKEDKTDKLLDLLPKLTDAILKITERPPSVNNTNCNNKMTINMYLNEECKNAMNLTDFVNKVQVSLDDLMYTQQHGYVKGISNIFVKQLQDMDPKDRPIHCSDKKRMQFYVKEEDKWEKDNQHSKIDNSIAKITHKQILKIREWEDKHPNFLEDDKLTHIWQKMCSETMGGVQDAERDKNCSNIKKEVSNVVEVKEAMKD